MALDLNTFNSGAQPAKKGVAPVIHSYGSTADTAATIMASGYFNSLVNMFDDGDLILVKGSDTQQWGQVSISGTTVLVVAVPGGAGDVGISHTSLNTTLNYGLNLLDSTLNQAYTLPTPLAGGEVLVVSRTASTGVTVIDNSTAVTIGSSGATVTLTAMHQSARLRAISATRWESLSQGGGTVS